MVDYKILDGIPGYAVDEDVRHLAASIGLFFVRNDGNIVPIAIQLNQIPGEGNPIYTPNDNQYDWIAAKLWLRNADTQCHQVRFYNSLIRPQDRSAWFLSFSFSTEILWYISYYIPTSGLLHIHNIIYTVSINQLVDYNKSYLLIGWTTHCLLVIDHQ